MMTFSPSEQLFSVSVAILFFSEFCIKIFHFHFAQCIKIARHSLEKLISKKINRVIIENPLKRFSLVFVYENCSYENVKNSCTEKKVKLPLQTTNLFHPVLCLYSFVLTIHFFVRHFVCWNFFLFSVHNLNFHKINMSVFFFCSFHFLSFSCRCRHSGWRISTMHSKHIWCHSIYSFNMGRWNGWCYLWFPHRPYLLLCGKYIYTL